MVYVNVLLFFTTIITSVGATKTTMRYVYFENTNITNNSSQTIVEATFDRKTVSECAITCMIEGAVKCYCNNKTDGTAVSDSTAADGIIYVRVTRAYEGSRSDQASRSDRDETTYYINDGKDYASCRKIANANYRYPGIYSIKNSMPTGFKEIYCTNNVYDWTVFQKRFDGSEEFYRNWTDYVNGFGSPGGEFWLGLEVIHQATFASTCELMIRLEAEISNPILASGYAKYSSFWIGGADTNYTLHVSGFSGTYGIGDSLFVHNNRMFTTYDADNDNKPTENCATKCQGAWWYGSCHHSNLNGLYLNGTHTTDRAKGMEWYDPWEFNYSLLSTHMMYKCT